MWWGLFSPYIPVPEVLVNGQEYTVPYVTEEPLWLLRPAMPVKSSSGAGGFTAQGSWAPDDRTGSLYQVADPEQAQEKIASKKAELL